MRKVVNILNFLTHKPLLTRKILTHKLLTYTDFSQTDFKIPKISPIYTYDHHFCVPTCSVLITNSLASQCSQKAGILILITHHRHHRLYGVSIVQKARSTPPIYAVFCSKWQGLPPDPQAHYVPDKNLQL